jgi:hypothetical protein
MAVTRRNSRALAIMRWGGTLVAVGALVALGVTTPPGTAKAANAVRPASGGGSGYDQLTGIGSTSSAVTVPWKSGLLNSNNTAINTNTNGERNSNSDRASTTGDYSFMDGDFSGLTVTVSQTQDIGHGGVTVSWTWKNSAGQPQGTIRGSGIQAYFLQMMECYGDSNSGPSPEDCEFGAPGLSGSGSGAGGNPTVVPSIEQRTGQLCAASVVPQVGMGIGSQQGSGPSSGCDPFEPAGGPSQPTDQAHIDPCPQGGCSPGVYSIPFVPVDPSLGAPAYQDNDLSQYFNAFNTNEVQAATTAPDGTGEQQFETDTFVQAPGLGCGEQEANGQTQGCWLVIVPRGQYEPNGFQLNNFNSSAAAANEMVSSAISAGNWAQRIQVHLSYAPLPSFCQPGQKTDSPEMEGTPLITRAVQSWEVSLNQESNCARIFQQTEVSEQQVTSDFVTAGDTSGLAFTTNPIGSDRKRQGTFLPPLPNIVYAPVAVAGMGFGFHIDEYDPLPPAGTNYTFGYLTTPVKLTPQLLARSLTQVYRTDLPDYAPSLAKPSPGPAWSVANPADIANDPVFEKLNPEVEPYGGANSIAPFDTQDHSALYQQIWNWVQGDSAATGWLDGTTKDPAVTADPDYVHLRIGKSPNFDSMPRAYSSAVCPTLQTDSGPHSRCSPDQIPYVFSFDVASAAVVTANPLTYTSNWDPSVTAPDGSPGFWDKTGIEPPGRIFTWTVDDTPLLAGYGLIPADLCDDSGAGCVGLTTQSVAAAVANAKPDSAGLLQVNPASPGAGAYPLTDIIYAAVRTDEAPQLLNDYADFISYAANQGQSVGQSPGDLPAGYLPLPSKLVTQANAVVAKLRQIAGGQPTSPATPTTSVSSGPTPTTGGPSTAAPGSGSGSTTQPAAGTTPASTPNPTAGTSATTSAASGGSTPTGPVIVPPTVQLAAGNTTGQPVGPVREVLVVVLIIGIAGAGGGILLRRGRMPRWRGRSR